MSRKGKISIEQAIKERKVLQSRIREKWGEEKVKEVKARLCVFCKKRTMCLLLPLTYDGSDCNYFEERDIE